MSREKVTAEERIAAAKACIEGKISQSEAARRLGVDERSVGIWVKRYTYLLNRDLHADKPNEK